MLPRLASSQFGLFDDGKSITAAKEMAKDISDLTLEGDQGQFGPVSGLYNGLINWIFEADQGRFRPFYWLSFSLIYWIFGLKPFWFFLGNTILLILSTWMLMNFTQMVTERRFQAWTAGLLFALSGPVIENFYTLSKGEPLQMALLLLAMLSSAWMFRTTGTWKQLLFGFLGMLAMFSAMLVKETSVVMIPISMVWLFLAWLHQRRSPQPGRQSGWKLKSLAALAVFSVFSFGLFVVLRRMMISRFLAGGSYRDDYSIQAQTILSSLVRWAGWSVRDFIFILPLLLMVILWWSAKRKSLDQGFILEALVWW